jgi:hypothetical protein
MPALAIYLFLSFALFGIRLIVHGGGTYPGIGVDPQIYTWSFAWWPHAILHGQNPIYTHVVWAPDGVDLAWVTSVPGLALLFAPLTLLAGPLAAYDAAAVLMPALAAWTAFLLCRHVTRSFWPSLAGGYLFGFSSYMLGQFQGHLNLTSVFLLPLVAFVVLRFFEGGLDGRGLVLRLGALLALQVAFSTEVAFTLTLVLLLGVVLAFALVPSARRRARAIALPLAGAYALAAVLVAPLIYYLLTDFHSETINRIAPADLFGADLLNFVVPTRLVLGGGWADPVARHFQTGFTEGGAYLGAPTVLILGWLALRARRSPALRFLFAGLAVVIVASFGTWLHVRGHKLMTMPWEHIGYLPLFNQVLPVRLSVYIALGAAVGVAMWAASRAAPFWARVALPALAVLFLLPDLGLATWSTTVREPSFITQGFYKRCLAKNENVLALPFGEFGDSMLWQADARFWFRMAGGHLGPVPPLSFQRPPTVAAIAVDGKPGPLRTYLRLKHVDAIVLEGRRSQDWLPFLRSYGQPERVGGVLLYPISRRTSSPCRTSPAARA